MDLAWSRFKRLPDVQSPILLQRERCCPLTGIGKEAEEEIFRMDGFQFYDDINAPYRITHRVVFNPESGMVYTNPVYTRKGYSLLFGKAAASYENAFTPHQLDWVWQSGVPMTHVCDIGCGEGTFLRALPSSIRKTGIDIDQNQLDKAKAHLPSADFIESELIEVEIPHDADVVTMFHVLEHLPAPLYTLCNLRERFSGYLFLEIPVIDSPSCDIVGVLSPQHLTHFSRASVLKMLVSSDWQILDAYTAASGYRILAEAAPPSGLLLCPKPEIERLKIAIYLHQWWRNIQQVKLRLSILPPKAQVIVWGAGNHTEYLVHHTNLFSGDREFLIVDQDPLKAYTVYHGIPVIPPHEADFKSAYVVISSFHHQRTIEHSLFRLGVPSSRIISLY